MCKRLRLQIEKIHKNKIHFYHKKYKLIDILINVSAKSFFSAGKGQSIWDKFVHETNNVCNGDTGDVAADSYHRYDKDIEALKRLGV